MEEDKNQKIYEISFLVKTEADLAAVPDRLKAADAEIVERGPVNSIKLAYPIAKNESAYFSFAHFKMDPDKAKQLNQDLRFNPKILRHLIITPPPAKPEKKSAISGRVRVSKKEVKSELTNEALEEKLAALKSESGI